VTSDGTLDGTLNGNPGLAGSNIVCNNAALAAGLGGHWVSWLSSSITNAISRLIDVSPWYLVDNTTLVFPTLASITASGPLVGITMSEDGLIHISHPWTGTLSTGLKSANNCLDWTSNIVADHGDIGDPNPGPTWTQSVPSFCFSTSSLYCFEQ
jgi:hypothetical protein